MARAEQKSSRVADAAPALPRNFQLGFRQRTGCSPKSPPSIIVRAAWKRRRFVLRRWTRICCQPSARAFAVCGASLTLARRYRGQRHRVPPPLTNRGCRSLPSAAPTAKAVGMAHPVWQWHAVPMTTARLGASPARSSAEEECRRNREGQDDRAGTRSRDGFSRIGDNRIHTAFSVWAGQPSGRGHKLDEVSTIVRTDAAVTGGRQKNPTCLGARRAQIDVGRPACSPKQMIDFIADHGRLGGRRRHGQCRRPVCRHTDKCRQQDAKNHRESPCRNAMQPVTSFNVFVTSRDWRSRAAGNIATAAEADQCLQDQVYAGQQP